MISTILHENFSDMKMFPFHDITREQCFPEELFLYCNPLQKQKNSRYANESFLFSSRNAASVQGNVKGSKFMLCAQNYYLTTEILQRFVLNRPTFLDPSLCFLAY
jgi:hypothetical protein